MVFIMRGLKEQVTLHFLEALSYLSFVGGLIPHDFFLTWTFYAAHLNGRIKFSRNFEKMDMKTGYLHIKNKN